MLPLTLHHYGFLTADTVAWLEDNETLLGKPFFVSDTIRIVSQKVSVTFIQQTAGAVITELVQPDQDNQPLQKMISKGVTIYHAGFLVAVNAFDSTIKKLEEKGYRSMPVFYSEAFKMKRCVFLINKHLGMIELIEG